MKSVIYIAEPRYGRYEGIYLFGGEPMVQSEVDYLNSFYGLI